MEYENKQMSKAFFFYSVVSTDLAFKVRKWAKTNDHPISAHMLMWDHLDAYIIETTPPPPTYTSTLSKQAASVITTNKLINHRSGRVYTLLHSLHVVCLITSSSSLQRAAYLLQVKDVNAFYVHAGLSECQGIFFSDSSLWPCPPAISL